MNALNNVANRIIINSDKRGRETVSILGYDSLVDGMIACHAQLEDSKAELSLYKNGGHPDMLGLMDNGLLGVVEEARKSASDRGSIVNHFKVHGSKAISVIYRETYSKIPTKYEAQLRDSLGDHFDTLFCRGVDLKVCDGVTLVDVMNAANQGFEAISRIVEFKEYLKPVSDYTEKRQILSNELSDEVAAVLDDVIDQVRYAPQVRMK